MNIFSGSFSPLKRFYKFVLKRAIGKFLKHDLDLDQLDVQLGDGVVELRNLELDIEVFNELCEGMPLRIIRSHIGLIKATIPWRNIFSENCKVTLDGLELVLAPAHEVDKSLQKSQLGKSSILEVDIADMDAKELRTGVKLHKRLQKTLEESGTLEKEDTVDLDEDSTDTADSLQVVASFLEQVISQIELEIRNVSFRIQHLQDLDLEEEDELDDPTSSGTNRQTVLVVRLPWLSFGDESGKRTSSSAVLSSSDQNSSNNRMASGDNNGDVNTDTLNSGNNGGGSTGPKYEYHKCIRFHGFRVELFEQVPLAAMDDSLFFQEDDHPLRPQMIMPPQIIVHGDNDQDCLIRLHIQLDRGSTGSQPDRTAPSKHGRNINNTSLNKGNNESISSGGPRVDVSCFIRSLCALLTPHQLALLADLFEGIAVSSSKVAEQTRLLEEQERRARRLEALNRSEWSSFTSEATSMSNSTSTIGGTNHNFPDGKSPHRPSSRIAKQVNESVTGIGGKPLTQKDFSVIEDLLQNYNQMDHQSAPSHLAAGQGSSLPYEDPLLSSHDQFYEFKTDNTNPGSNHGNSERFDNSSVEAMRAELGNDEELWRVKVQVLHGRLILLEDNDDDEHRVHWPDDWWLSPLDTSPLPNSEEPWVEEDTANPPALVDPKLIGVIDDHVLFSLHNTIIFVSQTSVDSQIHTEIGQLKIFEYLKQVPVVQSTSSSSTPSRNSSTGLPRQEAIKFRARSLIHFQESKHTASSSSASEEFDQQRWRLLHPAVRVDLKSLIHGKFPSYLPPTDYHGMSTNTGHSDQAAPFSSTISSRYSQPPIDPTLGPVGQRLILRLAPVSINLDLDLSVRLAPILAAVSDSSKFLLTCRQRERSAELRHVTVADIVTALSLTDDPQYEDKETFVTVEEEQEQEEEAEERRYQALKMLSHMNLKGNLIQHRSLEPASDKKNGPRGESMSVDLVTHQAQVLKLCHLVVLALEDESWRVRDMSCTCLHKLVESKTLTTPILMSILQGCDNQMHETALNAVIHGDQLKKNVRQKHYKESNDTSFSQDYFAAYDTQLDENESGTQIMFLADLISINLYFPDDRGSDTSTEALPKWMDALGPMRKERVLLNLNKIHASTDSSLLDTLWSIYFQAVEVYIFYPIPLALVDATAPKSFSTSFWSYSSSHPVHVPTGMHVTNILSVKNRRSQSTDSATGADAKAKRRNSSAPGEIRWPSISARVRSQATPSFHPLDSLQLGVDGVKRGDPVGIKHANIGDMGQGKDISAAELFFQSLPSFRWWEPVLPNGSSPGPSSDRERDRMTGDYNFSMNFDRNGSHFAPPRPNSDQPSTAPAQASPHPNHSTTTSARMNDTNIGGSFVHSEGILFGPDHSGMGHPGEGRQAGSSSEPLNGTQRSARFEADALDGSETVVTIYLPNAALNVTKYEFDLLLLLYQIYLDSNKPLEDSSAFETCDNGTDYDKNKETIVNGFPASASTLVTDTSRLFDVPMAASDDDSQSISDFSSDISDMADMVNEYALNDPDPFSQSPYITSSNTYASSTAASMESSMWDSVNNPSQFKSAISFHSISDTGQNDAHDGGINRTSNSEHQNPSSINEPNVITIIGDRDVDIDDMSESPNLSELEDAADGVDVSTTNHRNVDVYGSVEMSQSTILRDPARNSIYAAACSSISPSVSMHEDGQGDHEDDLSDSTSSFEAASPCSDVGAHSLSSSSSASLSASLSVSEVLKSVNESSLICPGSITVTTLHRAPRNGVDGKADLDDAKVSNSSLSSSSSFLTTPEANKEPNSSRDEIISSQQNTSTGHGGDTTMVETDLTASVVLPQMPSMVQDALNGTKVGNDSPSVMTRSVHFADTDSFAPVNSIRPYGDDSQSDEDSDVDDDRHVSFDPMTAFAKASHTSQSQFFASKDVVRDSKQQRPPWKTIENSQADQVNNRRKMIKQPRRPSSVDRRNHLRRIWEYTFNTGAKTASSSLPQSEPSPPTASQHSASVWATIGKSHKHHLALKLSLDRGSLCLHENPWEQAKGSGNTPTPSPKVNNTAGNAAAARPQTFYAWFNDLSLFQVAQFNHKPLTYLTIKTQSLALREYATLVTSPEELHSIPCLPVLFTTMSPTADERSHYGQGASSSSSPNSTFSSQIDPMFANPVLIANIVINDDDTSNPLLRESLVRSTLAVINARALTFQYMVASSWMLKLQNFFTDLSLEDEVLNPSLLAIEKERRKELLKQQQKSSAQSFSTSATSNNATEDDHHKDCADVNEEKFRDINEAPVVALDKVRIFVNAFDCAIDYNPPNFPGRAVLGFDHLNLQTEIYPNAPVSVINLEVRDAILYLVDYSPKLVFAPVNFAPSMIIARSQTRNMEGLQEEHIDLFFNDTEHIPGNDSLDSNLSFSALAKKFETDNDIHLHMLQASTNADEGGLLHHLFDDSIMNYLESQGFVRIATLDVMTVMIQQTYPDILNQESKLKSGFAAPHLNNPELLVECSNNMLTLFTCADSLQTFVHLLGHFQASIAEVRLVDEIHLAFAQALERKAEAERQKARERFNSFLPSDEEHLEEQEGYLTDESDGVEQYQLKGQVRNSFFPSSSSSPSSPNQDATIHKESTRFGELQLPAKEETFTRREKKNRSNILEFGYGSYLDDADEIERDILADIDDNMFAAGSIAFNNRAGRQGLGIDLMMGADQHQIAQGGIGPSNPSSSAIQYTVDSYGRPTPVTTDSEVGPLDGLHESNDSISAEIAANLRVAMGMSDGVASSDDPQYNPILYIRDDNDEGSDDAECKKLQKPIYKDAYKAKLDAHSLPRNIDLLSQVNVIDGHFARATRQQPPDYYNSFYSTTQENKGGIQTVSFDPYDTQAPHSIDPVTGQIRHHISMSSGQPTVYDPEQSSGWYGNSSPFDSHEKERSTDVGNNDEGDGQRKEEPVFIDDHVAVPATSFHQERYIPDLTPPPSHPQPEVQFMLIDISVCWRLFGGADFGTDAIPSLTEFKAATKQNNHANTEKSGSNAPTKVINPTEYIDLVSDDEDEKAPQQLDLVHTIDPVATKMTAHFNSPILMDDAADDMLKIDLAVPNGNASSSTRITAYGHGIDSLHLSYTESYDKQSLGIGMGLDTFTSNDSSSGLQTIEFDDQHTASGGLDQFINDLHHGNSRRFFDPSVATSSSSSSSSSSASSSSSSSSSPALSSTEVKFEQVEAGFEDSEEDITLRSYWRKLWRIRKNSSTGKRRTDQVLELNLSGVHLRSDQYPREEHISQWMVMAIKKFELVDHIFTSPYRKLLCAFQQRQPQDLHANMARFELTTLRPDIRYIDRDEYKGKLSLLPLRLYIDQDTVEFLIEFFNNVNLASLTEEERQELARKISDQAQSAFQPANQDDLKNSSQRNPPTSGNEKNIAGITEGLNKENSNEQNFEDAAQDFADEVASFIQSFEFSGLKLCIDYKPKRVDYQSLQDGDYLQFIHLFPLEDVEVDIKSIKILGVQGWDQLGLIMATELGTDIATTQAHRYLAGVQPIRSLVNVGSGVVDLLVVPIQQYRKDGKWARGLTKGATSFLKSVAMETVNVTTRVVQGAQTILEGVDNAVGSGSVFSNRRRRPSSHTRRDPFGRIIGGGHAGAALYGGQLEDAADEVRSSIVFIGPDGAGSRRNRSRLKNRFSKMANQPQSYKEGLKQAYESLVRGLKSAHRQMVVLPREDYKKGGTKLAVKSVVKALPGAVLRPMIGATEAISKALLGVSNSMDPMKKRSMDDKYKDQANAL